MAVTYLVSPKVYLYFNETYMAAYHGKTSEALDWLEQSFERYCPRADLAYEEPLFKKIRKTKRFKALIAKHFPNYKP